VCGTGSCNLADSVCCDYHNTDPTCLEPGTLCFPGVDVRCDGPEDCSSQEVCCATVVVKAQTREFLNMECRATCIARDERVVCGDTGSCPAGQTCSVSDIAPPYWDCR
jgi:hypothetical protein